jgi:hypothetical protein
MTKDETIKILICHDCAMKAHAISRFESSIVQLATYPGEQGCFMCRHTGLINEVTVYKNQYLKYRQLLLTKQIRFGS